MPLEEHMVFHFPEASIANHLTVLESSIQQNGQRQSIHQIQERAIKNAKDGEATASSHRSSREHSHVYLFHLRALFHLSWLLLVGASLIWEIDLHLYWKSAKGKGGLPSIAKLLLLSHYLSLSAAPRAPVTFIFHGRHFYFSRFAVRRIVLVAFGPSGIVLESS